MRARPSRRPPALVLALAALGLGFSLLPLAALLWRLPWRRLPDILAGRALQQALWLSLGTASAAALVALVLGLPLAWSLARWRLPGRALLKALCSLSLVLPPVVGGVALLFALGRRGLIGRHLYEQFGLSLPFSPAAVVVAEAYVALPFMVLTLEAGIRALDPALEEAARSLGAGPWTCFRRISLPALRPTLLAGTVLAWARALGEFGATITFAGNSPGRTQTLPLAIYLALEQDPDAALAMSLVLMGASLAVLLLLRDRWWGGIAG